VNSPRPVNNHTRAGGWSCAFQLRTGKTCSGPDKTERNVLQNDFLPLQRHFYPLQNDFLPLQRRFYPLQNHFLLPQCHFLPLQDVFYPLQYHFCPLQGLVALFHRVIFLKRQGFLRLRRRTAPTGSAMP